MFGFLLLSAVNTAIVDLIAISFLMSRDDELPLAIFQKLNKFGVPNAAGNYRHATGGAHALLVLAVRH